jgi:uncharacterized membrane protein YkvA (DUF1232 family)
MLKAMDVFRRRKERNYEFYVRLLKETGRTFKREARFYRCVLKHPRTPRSARWLLGAAVAYILLPFDIVPDFIPVLGQIDDIVIVPGLVILARRLIPDDVIKECREKMKTSPEFAGSSPSST